MIKLVIILVSCFVFPPLAVVIIAWQIHKYLESLNEATYKPSWTSHKN